jgi:hypothetical protein
LSILAYDWLLTDCHGLLLDYKRILAWAYTPFLERTDSARLCASIQIGPFYTNFICAVTRVIGPSMGVGCISDVLVIYKVGDMQFSSFTLYTRKLLVCHTRACTIRNNIGKGVSYDDGKNAVYRCSIYYDDCKVSSMPCTYLRNVATQLYCARLEG